MDLNKLIMHPVRLRIIQTVGVTENCTAEDIGNALPEVPRTTLYRQISLLIQHRLLEVNGFKPGRGNRKKIYKLSTEGPDLPKGTKTTDLLPGYFAHITETFLQYEQNPAADPIKDMIFANVTGVTVTDEEYMQLLQDINDLLGKYLTASPHGRRRRTIALVGMPPEDMIQNTTKL